MDGKFDFLSDTTEASTTRFVVFVSEKTLHRYDLAIVETDRFYGKKLVVDLQSGRTAIIGPDDLEEEGYLESVYRLSEEQADELREFLAQVVGPITFTDN